MDVSINKLSLYTAGTLRIVFDSLNDILNYKSPNYTLVSFDGKNFINDSKDENGHIDETKLYRNVGTVLSCEPGMKDKLINELAANRVTFAAIEMIEPTRDGKETTHCYFPIDRRDKEIAEHITADLNQGKYMQRMDTEEFMEYCEKNNLSIRGISAVEPEVFDIAMKDGGFRFPFCAVKKEYGYDIRIPADEERQAAAALQQARIICSGHTRDVIVERETERKEEIADAIAKIIDSKHSYIIMDTSAPENYIRTDANGFHNIIRTEEGEREITGSTERLSPHYEQMAYNLVSGFNGIAIIQATDKDAEKQMEDVRERAAIQKEPDINMKMEYYKRSMRDYIRESVEQDFKGRLKDNEHRFGNAIAHEVMVGNDAQKLDLESDMALNGRAINGAVKETSIDLSDLNGEAFSYRFCEEVLGTRAKENEMERRVLNETILANTALRELAEEPPEVKQAVIDEIQTTIEEVHENVYEFEDIEHADFEKEISIEKNETLTIDTREFDR